MKPDSAFSSGSLQAYLTLVLVCGIALAMSIQPAARIDHLRSTDLTYPPALFGLVSVFALGLFAVSRGAAIAAASGAHRLRFRLLVDFARQDGLAFLLTLPFFVYSRALAPTGALGVALLLVYAALLSLFLFLVSFQLELRGYRRRRGAFLTRYGVYLALCLIPFAAGMTTRSLALLASVSPIGMAMRILQGSSIPEMLVGFVLPVLGSLWTVMRLRRIERRPHRAV